MEAAAVRVLLTEDETVVADLIREMLAESEPTPLESEWAPDLKTCLELLSADHYDVLLLDLYLPDSLGLDTILAVREHHPGIPIVVITGGGEECLARGALNAGAQDFFIKTELNRTLLTRVIKYAIERKALELKLERQAEELKKRVREKTREFRTAKDQWENTFDAVPDLIIILDENHKIIKANSAMAKAVGATPESLVGRSCFEVIHGTDAPIPNCPHALLLQDGAEHSLDFHEPFLGLDLFVSTSPLVSESGRLWGSVHVARDISPIKEAQRSIAASERQHRMFMDRLPDPTVVYDISGKVIFCNKAFEKVFGWSSEELMDRKVDFIPAEALPETLDKIKQLMDGKPVADFESVRFAKDGRRLYISLNAVPLFSTGNEITGSIVVLRDLTAMHKAKAAKKASERKFQNLVETMNEGFIVSNPEGGIEYANTKFSEMLGLGSQKLSGYDYKVFLDEHNQAVLTKQLAKRSKGIFDSYELVFTKRDGTKVFTIVSPQAMEGEEGEYLGAFSVVTDITAQKNLESQLIQAQKMEGIGQLAAGIAHEINTPTQYVSSNTGFLEDGFNDLLTLLNTHLDLVAKLKEKGLVREETAKLDELALELDYEFLAEEIPKALKANREGLESIARIVLSIKEFAHPGSDEKRLSDLNKAVKNTITVAKNEWKYVAEMVTDLDPKLPPVRCVVGEINQVILNLIVNAAQAIAEVKNRDEGKKGRIRITTRNTGDEVMISITDSGPGIPEKIRNRIFDPFFTTKEPGKGTGQGLAIAYRAIVDHHHGEITVDSGEGEGTTFTIRLPLSGEEME